MNEQEQTQQEAQKHPNGRTWTEAPASLTVKAHVHGRDTMLTLRGDSGADVLRAADALFDWLDKHAPTPEKRYEAARAPEGTLPAPIAPGTPTPADTRGASQPASTNPQIVIVSRMEVTPRADGKVDAKFFAVGHEYPDIYTTREPAIMASMLKSGTGGEWTPEHFKVASAYDVSFVIEWQPSEKLNRNGKPYKNIVGIRPA